VRILSVCLALAFVFGGVASGGSSTPETATVSCFHDVEGVQLAVSGLEGSEVVVWSTGSDGILAPIAGFSVGADPTAIPLPAPEVSDPLYLVTVTSGTDGIVAIVEPEFEWSWN
jgi:hypothetical protein